MAHILKYDYWESGSGSFYCGDINAVGTQGNKWYVPSRLLNISAVQYVALLISCFNATICGYQNNTLVYKFTNETDFFVFCKYINTKAKKADFYI